MKVYKCIAIISFCVFISLKIINIACAGQLEKPDKYSYSIQVLDYQNNKKPVLEQNPKMLLRPASVQKVFTAYIAFNVLGAEYQFQNSLYYLGKITKNKILQGNVYMYFGGNPDFTNLDILDMIKRIKNLGVDKINGNIIIDSNEFDEKLYPRGWDIENQIFCFAPPISPIIINKNCFFVTPFSKNSEIKLKYDVEINPKIQNNAKILSNEDCFLDLLSNDHNKYHLVGCEKDKESLPNRLSIAIRNPNIFLSDLINFYSKKQKLQFNKIEYGKLNNDAKLLRGYKSKKVSDLIVTLLKNSNNLIAELIFKKISFLHNKKSGSFRDAAAIYTNHINNYLNLEEKSFDIVDASGLSQKNLVSSEIINKFLLYLYEGNEEIKNLMLNSLPNIKVESLIDSDDEMQLFKECKIFAKTGTLDNVSSLAGYIFYKGQLRYIFSIIINNSLENKKSREEQIFKIVKSLLKNLVLKNPVRFSTN